MNNELNPKLIAAKNKAIAIIKSCKTYDHIINTASYLDLFFKKFNNQEEYKDLILLFKNKIIELNYQNI